MKYPTIDRKMSDCQVGARKRRGCKDNIFVINGIIHEVLRSKKHKPIVLQIYDYAQMFDSINDIMTLSYKGTPCYTLNMTIHLTGSTIL